MKDNMINILFDEWKKDRKTLEYMTASNKAIDAFDFDTVEKVMNFLKWEWSGVGIPDTYDMKEFCRRELLSTFTHMDKENAREECLSCGGFHFHTWLDDENNYQCEIKFVVEYSHSDF